MNRIKLLSVFSLLVLMSNEVNSKVEKKTVQRKKGLINAENAQKRSKSLLKIKDWIGKQSKKIQELQTESQAIFQDSSLTDDEKRSKLVIIQEKYSKILQSIDKVEKRMGDLIKKVSANFYTTKFSQGYYKIYIYPNPFHVYSSEYIGESFTDLTNEFAEALDKAFLSFNIDES